ncbi:MAG: CapA family protein [Paludibacter sp.]|nr:CapA family protein [Paludibacter sp.]
MKKYLLLFSILFLFSGFSYNNDFAQNPAENPEESLIIVFAGDIMGHSPQFQAAYNPTTKRYSYDACFRHVKSIIQSADIAIANLEVPIAGKPYSGYPNFSSPDELLDGLKNAGYDVLLTANNHVLDRSKKGLERTIWSIKKRKLLSLGSYIDTIQRDSTYPLIIEKKGIKIALLNYTYGTNGIQVEKPNVVNYLDSMQIKKDIATAKLKNADQIIMTVHWGTEYELESNAFQKVYAAFFVRNGVTLVVGGHPHVVQNAEVLYNADSLAVPVYYSLGNSISNQRKLNTDGGILLSVEIGTKLKKIISSSYLPVYVHKGVLNNVFQYHLIPSSDFINHPQKYPLSQADSLSLVVFDQSTRNRLNNMQLFDK